MKKERKYTRKRTSDYFLVRHLQTHQIIGRIANLSVGGLMLIATKSLTVHRDYKLQLEFPRIIAEKSSITFTAESRWSKYNGHADWWEIGFEIREIDPLDVVILQQAVQDMNYDSNGQPDTTIKEENKLELKLEYIKTR